MNENGRFKVAFNSYARDAAGPSRVPLFRAAAERVDARARLGEERAVFPRSNKWLRGVQPRLSAVPLP